MKSPNLLLALIGGWILFIALDSTNGHMSSLGVRALHKPLQLAWFITKTVRTVVVFLLAVVTFLLVLQKNRPAAG
jgi:hypothetical protein